MTERSRQAVQRRHEGAVVAARPIADGLEIEDANDSNPANTGPWSTQSLRQLIGKLNELRADLLAMEEANADRMHGVADTYRASARNLLHYLALRRHDIRETQELLASLGLSSLGRAEGCVKATIEAVLRILEQLAGKPATSAEVRT